VTELWRCSKYEPAACQSYTFIGVVLNVLLRIRPRRPDFVGEFKLLLRKKLD